MQKWFLLVPVLFFLSPYRREAQRSSKLIPGAPVILSYGTYTATGLRADEPAGGRIQFHQQLEKSIAVTNVTISSQINAQLLVFPVSKSSYE